MLTLLKADDKNILGNSNFAKNAIFYKDMLCFCEAYRLVLENRDNLPEFCFNKGELCLEGICLLMKMYATEFKFETIKLTLDYLKILYFSMAAFAGEDGEVDVQTIIAEFDNYKEISNKFCEEQKHELEEKQAKVKAKEREVKQNINKGISMKKNSKVLNVLSIVMLVLSVLAIFAPVFTYIKFTANSSAFAFSIVGVVLGFVLTIAFKIISVKLKNHSSDVEFHVTNLKKSLTEEQTELSQFETKYYKIYCEKYEYQMCFSEIISHFGKVLAIDEILARARAYKFLSYNVVYDINRLFKSQQREIDDIILQIENINLSSDYKKEFASIYSAISQQDWLYYNTEIRLHYLKKFADICEREHEWKLEYNNTKINPFDVDVKSLTREKVAYTQSEDMKLVVTNLSELLLTKYFKDFEELNFRNGYSVDDLKRIKSNYLKHFYNTTIFEGERSMLFDKKENKKLAHGEKLFEIGQKIPTLIGLKLRLIENGTGLGNSDAKTIKTIASAIFNDAVHEKMESLILSEDDIEYPKFTSDSIEETLDEIIYNVNGEKKVGYKLK